MELRVAALEGPGAAGGDVEIVERKGLGHPDSLCDALAEEFGRALCRHYEARFGRLLHHNVDKVLLSGGAARPAFGGGEVRAPVELFLAGRATNECEGERVPLEALAREASRAVLRARVPELDPDAHVRLHCLVHPGAAELVDLYGQTLANDTSCGVGYAPLSELERVVLRVEAELTGAETRRAHPALGPDVKVMGVRLGERIALTVACAVVGRHCASLADYLEITRLAAGLAERAARAETARPLEVHVNRGDRPERGSVYLTVTGTSAEAGDDGEAGRGNRVNGLITPYRPMTLESVAGKNPVTHVGKLYNVAAGLLAESLVEELPGVAEAECRLVSQIGRPVAEPHVVDVRVRAAGGARAADPRGVAELVRRHLAEIGSYARELVDGTLALDRWPLRARAPQPPRAAR